MYSLEFLYFYVLRLNVLNDTEQFQCYDLLICCVHLAFKVSHYDMNDEVQCCPREKKVSRYLDVVLLEFQF